MSIKIESYITAKTNGLRFSGVAIQPGMYLSDGGVAIFRGELGQLHRFGKRI